MYLKKLAEIRKQIDVLKAHAESIEPDAILEAFHVMESGSINGKNTVFSDENGKIVIQFRTKFDTNDISVKRLEEDILRVGTEQARSNAAEIAKSQEYIAELKELIAEAETKQKQLLTSPYLENLKKQKAIALKATEHKVAALAVYVKT